jgi:hypothetical protein
MKKILILLLVALLPVAFVSAIEKDFELYQAGIEQFAVDVASSLPLNSAVGLAWSDSYIGQFPHFGVGASVGFSTIPFSTASVVLEPLGLVDTITGNEAFQYIEQFGMPLPAYAVEARLGGFLFPFDVGVKVGILPPDFEPGEFVSGLNLDYTMAGFDVRVPIIEERGFIPELSIGGGYNYLRATIGIDGVYDENLVLTDFEVGGTVYPVELAPPSVEFNWAANAIDLKAQVSKNVLFFRPYAGVGAGLGFGRAGGGFEAELVSPSEAELEEIKTIIETYDLEQTIPEFNDEGFYVSAPMPADWAFRVYGGVGINILVVKLDIMAMYDFLGENFGGSVGLRVQL